MKAVLEKDLNDYLELWATRSKSRFLAGRIFRGVIQNVTGASPSWLVSVIRNGDTTLDTTRYACGVPGYVPTNGDTVDLLYRTKDEASVYQPVSYVQPRKIVLAVAASSVTFNLPKLGTNFMIEMQARGDNAVGAQECGYRFNADSSGSYAFQRTTAAGVAAPVDQESANLTQTSNRGWYVPGSTPLANSPGSARIWVPNYSGSFLKVSRVDSQEWLVATSGAAELNVDSCSHMWNNGAAITSVTIFPFTGNFVANSTFYLQVE